MNNTTSLLLRRLVLIAVIVNIAFNAFYVKLFPHLPDVQEVSMTYFNLFTPAGYAFSIWGIIYLSFIVYAVIQLLPAYRYMEIYDILAFPMISVNILGSAWILAFINGAITLSEIILLVTLILAFIMCAELHNKPSKHTADHNWLTMPFSLFFGWVSVAFIANTAAWLVSIGWHGGNITEEAWTITMILVAGAAGIFTAFAWRDFIYPLVISWSCIAIYVVRKSDHELIANTALIVSCVLLITAFAIITIQSRRFIYEEHHTRMK